MAEADVGHDQGCAAGPETVCDLHCHKYLKMKDVGVAGIPVL